MNNNRQGDEKVFCSKCGASVVGKYCSCCGQRIRSSEEEFKLEERRMEREFKNLNSRNNYGGLKDLYSSHLAQACWLAAAMKYRTEPSQTGYQQAIKNLEYVRDKAQVLFDKLINF